MTGRLTLCGTPIGHLGDLSERLGEVLSAADIIYAEDTRRSRKLLTYMNVQKPLLAFHEHSPDPIHRQVESELERGRHIAYMTDAGMPGISDPGYELVQMAIRVGAEVDVVPGPSAVLTALVMSGLQTDRFCFLGYFPAKETARMKWVDDLRRIHMTAVAFEAPHRIRSCLAFIENHLPDTRIAVCREMTKVHQEIIRGTATTVLSELKVVKGEFALVIEPVSGGDHPPGLADELAVLMARGLSQRQAIRDLAQRHRCSKKTIVGQLGDKQASDEGG